MFEHPDAGDFVKVPVDFPIILQPYLYTIGKLSGCGAALRPTQLLGTRSDAKASSAIFLSGKYGQFAPPTSDIEKIVIGLEF
jgi:hypothetical protein